MLNAMIQRDSFWWRWSKVAVFLVLLVWFLSLHHASPLPASAIADRVVIVKSNHTLTLYQGDLKLKTYHVALGRGGHEPKQRAGDNRVPEGTYIIDGRNPRSTFYRSLHISYPTPQQVAAAQVAGVHPGGEIMIHGVRRGFGWLGKFQSAVDWTKGCIAVTDAEIDEICRAVPDGTPVEIQH